MYEMGNDAVKLEGLLRKAVCGHQEYSKMATHGCGVDRHLLGLKLMAIENNIPIPEFFNSPAYIKSCNYRIVSRQFAVKSKTFMCHGPLMPDGYACCYNIRDNDILFGITSWKNNPETCSDRFGFVLNEALNNIMHVLLAAQKNECYQSQLKYFLKN